MQKSTIMESDERDLDAPDKRGNYTVCVVGCGRMGLPHACLFAQAGFKVLGVDKDNSILSAVKKGKSPFKETGLDKLIAKQVKDGRFTITDDAEEAASKSDIIILVVPTLVDEKNRPDYSYIKKACEEVGRGLRPGSLVIVASTVGPGITETLVRENLEKASELKAGKDFGLAFSPIRATSGRVLYDVTHYVRVLGAIDNKSLRTASLVLETVVKAGTIPVSNIRVAEAVKLFQNVQRDVNLALANEFASFCEKAGIDYLEAQKVANTDPYCHLLISGLVSGHIPKDPYLLVREAENLDVELRMVRLAREINESVVNHAVQLVREALRECGKALREAKIAVLGVSYKPNVKEPKGSRAKNIVKLLKAEGAKVKVYDPFFKSKELAELGYPAGRSFANVAKGTDCLIITVGHDQFRNLNLRKLKTLMRAPFAIVDIGHVIDLTKAEQEKIVYKGFGRGCIEKVEK
jgi:nucleotide sugar dehydrogenase